mmetsp:Transcript_1505/g.2680  ORF Transcript_1505/g.2680 Transcript_1505/m.2680 type:complete len:111 (+) Transcript_1505:303-635(+)
MKSPNSRSGCKQLAKFAKKLAEVVSDVARQFLPACSKTHVRRRPVDLSTCTLCSQKSVKTNTTSQPMPVTKNKDKKVAIVVLDKGVSTYANGTEVKMIHSDMMLKNKLLV